MMTGRPMSSSQYFVEPWLESCCLSMLFPSSSWHRVSRLLADELAAKLKSFAASQEGSSDNFAVAIRELTGLPFHEEYFSILKYDQDKMVVTSMPSAEKKQLIAEANTWLTDKLAKAVQGAGSEPLNTNLTQFVSHSQSIIKTGLDRHLFHLEKQSSLSSLPSLEQQTGPQELKTKKFIRSLPRKVDITSVHSERIGQSVLRLLQRDPKRIAYVCKALIGRPLPVSLRKFIWQETLFKDERKKFNESNVETSLRERFGRGVAKRLTVSGRTKANVSEICALIESSIRRVYEMCIHLDSSTKHIVQAAGVLNILHTYDGTHEPSLIYWLYPLQIAFEKPLMAEISDEEQLYELAMFLDLLNTNVFPNSLQIYAMAEQAFDILLDKDEELYSHLKAIGSRVDGRSSTSDQQGDFLIEALLREQTAANKLLDKDGSSETSIKSDPVLYLRKWIGDGFVSVLNPAALLFVWDQLFLTGWHSTAVRDISLALLLLLRPRFMAAHTEAQLRETFFRGPSALLTADIQQAYQLTREKSMAETVSDIPYLNRLKAPLSLDPWNQSPSSLDGSVLSMRTVKSKRNNLKKKKGTLNDAIPGEKGPKS